MFYWYTSYLYSWKSWREVWYAGYSAGEIVKPSDAIALMVKKWLTDG